MKLMPSSPPHIRSQDSNATVMFYVMAECIWQIKEIVFYYYGA